MKKALVCLALAAGAMAAPVLSFAQSIGPVTRAEVRADLVRLEQAGYNPSVGEDAEYPASIQAAEAKVVAQNAPQSTQSSYGGVTQSSNSSSGMRKPMSSDSSCVGPVSFCNVFFGS